MSRIVSVQIENLGGIKGDICFRLGTLTVIRGMNEENKSSIFDGIKQIFAGGHSPALLRRGAKIGRCTITLDDGRTASVTVTKRSTDYSVKSPQGIEMPAPRTLIEEMASAMSVDPSRLLRAHPKDLTKVLLELMPVSFTREEFNACISDQCFPERAPAGINGVAFEDMNLEELEAQRKQIYESRRQVNQQARDYEGELRNLQASLPPEDETKTDWAKRSQQLAELVKEAEDSARSAKETVDREEEHQYAEIRAEASRKTEAARVAAKAKREEIWSEWEPQIRKVTAAWSESVERMRTHDRNEGLRQQVAIAEKRFAEADKKAGALSRTLDAIAEMKEAKLANLPIAGLELRDGEVLFDGLPVERVNTAQRMALMTSIAAKMKGSVPLILWDGGEAFDGKMMDLLYQFAEKRQVQIMVTRVIEQGGFSIEQIPACESEQRELLTASG